MAIIFKPFDLCFIPYLQLLLASVARSFSPVDPVVKIEHANPYATMRRYSNVCIHAKEDVSAATDSYAM